MIVRAYLRASAEDQDANRARSYLEKFANDQGFKIHTWKTENASGATLKRPALFELLTESSPGDVLLIEQVDRLSRLTAADWNKLKKLIADKQVNIVSVDLPTSYATARDPESTAGRIMAAVNEMLLDVIAATSRKDYEDRRRRVAEGVEKAKKEGKYAGRPEDANRLELIATLLKAGKSYSDIQGMTSASRATIAKVARRLKEQ